MKAVVCLLLVLVAVDFTNATCRNDLEVCEEEKQELSNENDVLEGELDDCQEKIEKLNETIDEMKEKLEELKNQTRKNCAELLRARQTASGVYSIDPDGLGAFDVYCDQDTDGGGYTVIQRRFDGSVDFYLGWEDYKNGFGNIDDGEYWLGLEKIHRLTRQTENELRVDLTSWDGESVEAEYAGFYVSGEPAGYQLITGTFVPGGSAGDSLSYHNEMKFSTKDRDNDKIDLNCAENNKGAWWYNNCFHSNLNGLYHEGGVIPNPDGISWQTWKGYHYSAMESTMQIRPI